jgi:hypothetical protein
MSNLSTKNVERLLGELSSIKRSVEDLRKVVEVEGLFY